MVEMPPLGKRVKIVTQGPIGSTSHQGVVLPGAAPDHLTIKLANGYNISHPIDMVESIEEVADAVERNIELTKIERGQHFA